MDGVVRGEKAGGGEGGKQRAAGGEEGLWALGQPTGGLGCCESRHLFIAHKIMYNCTARS